MMLRATESEVAERWNAWLVDHNRRGAWIALALTAVLYPVFAVLDVLVAPHGGLWLLFADRFVIEVFTLAMFWVIRQPAFVRHGIALTAIYIMSVAVSIGLAVVVMGGARSPYYAGLNLVMIGAGLLFIWPRPVVLATHMGIVLLYIVPNLLADHSGSVLSGLVSLVFLVSTAAIVSAGQIFAFRNAHEQVANQLALELTTGRLEHAHDELKRLDRFKSRFFANITHELKTPLAMVLSPVELLIDGELGPVSDPQRATLRSVFRNGIKLLRLIGDLLDLSRLEESRLRLRVEEHDLTTYLHGLVGQVQALAMRKGVTLDFRPETPGVSAWCDIDRLERVFVNLLSNAVKFTPSGGHVSVTVRGSSLLGDSTAEVSVEDNGPGFDPALAERLFERFFQVEMDGARRYGGAGIGLALARELVDLHGGRIWGESAPGQGAKFTVALPRDREHFRAEVLDRRTSTRDQVGGQRSADVGLQDWTVQISSRSEFRLIDVAEVSERRVVERDADESGRGRTVLIVEDTPDVIRVVHMVLRQHFRVLAAPDGRRGLEIALREIPDLVIADLMMPEMDGLELTRRLRADVTTRHIPVLMLTARGDLEDRVAGLETGVNSYLTKPFAARELLTTVRSLLDTRDATADLVLAQQMDSLEVVAQGLAHEINNPLNYVKNAVARIKLDAAELARLATEPHQNSDKAAVYIGRAERMFKTAEAGIARIAETVDLMRRYSREGYSRELRPHDVWAAVSDVIAMVLPATGRSVSVTPNFEGDGTLECVPEELHQVFTNLIQNAIEAAPDETGQVDVTGRATATELTLSVKDNGQGIRQDDQARVFTPFFTTKSPGRGMGLGLAITWRVVKSLGGSVTLRSQPGTGAEFIVRIPRRRVPQPTASVPVERASTAPDSPSDGSRPVPSAEA